jgi:hypothetical protein
VQRFTVLKGSWAIARLDAGEPVPEWAAGSAPFCSITRTPDELSIVAPDAAVPANAKCERGWAMIRLLGPFAFDQVGVLASFTAPLAEAGVSVFAISTFDTDYVLVKSEQAAAARAALVSAGHELVAEPIGSEGSE